MAAPRSTSTRRFSPQLEGFCKTASALADAHAAEAILVLAERPLDWASVQECLGKHTMLVAADTEDQLAGSDDEEGSEANFETLLLGMGDAPVYERLTQALLEAVSEDLLETGSTVVTLYSSFEPSVIDSVSLIRLGEHLGKLTVRDLRQIQTKVPTETLKRVIDLAVEIGREGREGKPVGTLMVVGDHRKTLELSKPMGFDPVRGYSAAERSLSDTKVREGVKEIAQMDGAFIVSANGTVIASAQHLSAPASREISLSKGLGARHWAAAQVSRATEAIAIAVSASSGTVRVFQNGEVVLRIEPLNRAMTWRDFEAEADRDRGAASPKPTKSAKSKAKTTKAKAAEALPPDQSDSAQDAGG
ncbi:DNA integrity scanning protein DisA nucleotide-binding domain protein [Botrimarina hoheduenensis]|uniref:DNA integrity scanning protein DisA n=1 Tax=Botrimarina hoheduenensis TaxID=2528000 RepID=A0A5C5W054_9BACT|nr:diadenylate cyclase [Botrimarina hoheduenensis]TWT43401.1 DNA integrity scanning protein DisA [Botrimarina hoheduenensis]